MKAVIDVNTKMNVLGTIKLERFKNGIKLSEDKFPMRSYTLSFWEIMRQSMDGSFSVSYRPTSDNFSVNFTKSSSSSSNRLAFIVDATSLLPMAFGASDAPFNLDTRDLEDRIFSSVLQPYLPNIIVNQKGVTIQRVFENVSGAPVATNEIGVFTGRADSGGNATLVARDVFPSTYTIGTGEAVLATFELSLTDGGRNYHNIWKALGENEQGIFWRTDGSTFTHNCFNKYTESSGDDTGDDTIGILAGAGTTAPDFEDNDLESAYPEGSGTNQLNYGDVSVEDEDMGSDFFNFEIIRNIANNSGADITVRELGLFCNTSTNQKCLLGRSVLPTPVVIPNGSFRVARWAFNYQA